MGDNKPVHPIEQYLRSGTALSALAGELVTFATAPTEEQPITIYGFETPEYPGGYAVEIRALPGHELEQQRAVMSVDVMMHARLQPDWGVVRGAPVGHDGELAPIGLAAVPQPPVAEFGVVESGGTSETGEATNEPNPPVAEPPAVDNPETAPAVAVEEAI